MFCRVTSHFSHPAPHGFRGSFSKTLYGGGISALNIIASIGTMLNGIVYENSVSACRRRGFKKSVSLAGNEKGAVKERLRGR